MAKMKLKDRIQIYMKKQKPLSVVNCSIILVVLFALMTGITAFSKPSNKNVTFTSVAYNPLFQATFVGDIMMDRGVEQVAKRSGYASLFENVSYLWENSDYVLGNLESAVLNKDKSDYTKADKEIHLATVPEAIEALKEVGFNLMGVSNNHLADFGRKGVIDTLNILDRYELDYVGAGRNLEEAKKYHLTEVNNIKIATVAISDVIPKGASAQENKAGILSINSSGYLEVINDASEEADLTIVIAHFGEEYVDVTEEQETLAHDYIDAGADIVIGGHPHIVQPVETYKDGIIFYSIGNFVFDQGLTRTKDSMVINFTINEDGGSQFEVIPVRIKDAIPYITENSFFNNRIINELTKNIDSKVYQILEDRLVIKGPTIDLEDINQCLLEEQQLQEVDQQNSGRSQ